MAYELVNFCFYVPIFVHKTKNYQFLMPRKGMFLPFSEERLVSKKLECPQVVQLNRSFSCLFNFDHLNAQIS